MEEAPQTTVNIGRIHDPPDMTPKLPTMLLVEWGEGRGKKLDGPNKVRCLRQFITFIKLKFKINFWCDYTKNLSQTLKLSNISAMEWGGCPGNGQWIWYEGLATVDDFGRTPKEQGRVWQSYDTETAYIVNTWVRDGEEVSLGTINWIMSYEVQRDLTNLAE